MFRMIDSRIDTRNRFIESFCSNPVSVSARLEERGGVTRAAAFAVHVYWKLETLTLLGLFSTCEYIFKEKYAKSIKVIFECGKFKNCSVLKLVIGS